MPRNSQTSLLLRWKANAGNRYFLSSTMDADAMLGEPPPSAALFVAKQTFNATTVTNSFAISM
nr:hypothetical protein Iba_chr09aCG10210 [Ipomoea batatas]GMD30774.1 hypothetical protein Iba_chr09aCG10220 [Ipomoea batatas]